MANIDPKNVPDYIDPKNDKVHAWPHLVRIEFICAVLAGLALVIWGLFIDAPLEEAANPSKTPNPAKAPWYFLGLQEMLVYFDPWIAGVILPSLIIVGLVVIPYIDINPNGNGYYTWKERKFAIFSYCFGFLFLWVFLILIGVFFRGPGWLIFMPWEKWDTHKVVEQTNINLNMFMVNKFGLEFLRDKTVAIVFGLGLIGAYYSIGVIYYKVKVKSSELLQKLGPVRYGITAFLFLTMMALPIKMVLRIAFNIKYIVAIPSLNMNI